MELRGPGRPLLSFTVTVTVLAENAKLLVTLAPAIAEFRRPLVWRYDGVVVPLPLIQVCRVGAICKVADGIVATGVCGSGS